MSEFTLKTRLLAALEGKPVDKVPVCSVTQTGIVELMDKVGAAWPEAHTNPELMAKLAIANYELSGLEAVRLPYCLTVLGEAMGCEINMGTKTGSRLSQLAPTPKTSMVQPSLQISCRETEFQPYSKQLKLSGKK